MENKTGLQPVELVHYFEGWVESASPFGAEVLQTDRQAEIDESQTKLAVLRAAVYL